MVRWNHSRVARMELTQPSTTRQLCGDRVDSLGHDQHGSIGRLRKKVAQRTVETPRQHDALTILRDEGKGSFETKYGIDVSS